MPKAEMPVEIGNRSNWRLKNAAQVTPLALFGLVKLS